LAKFIRGDVVIVPFPFSDLTEAKRRPALVIADLDGDDYILCQITSRQIKDRYSVSIEDADFDDGSLKQSSNVRPNRIFTADQNIILYRIGHLRRDKFIGITRKIVDIMQAD